MNRLRLFLAACALALVTACSGIKTSPNGQLQAGYDTVNAYVDVTKTSLLRERITPAQAAKASSNAKNAMGKLDTARAVLATCKPPCTEYLDLLQALQPSLYEMEAELRRQQKESK